MSLFTLVIPPCVLETNNKTDGRTSEYIGAYNGKPMTSCSHTNAFVFDRQLLYRRERRWISYRRCLLCLLCRQIQPQTHDPGCCYDPCGWGCSVRRVDRQCNVSCGTCHQWLGSKLSKAAWTTIMLTRLQIGALVTAIPMYQAEVSTPESRGFMVSMHGVMFAMGKLKIEAVTNISARVM